MDDLEQLLKGLAHDPGDDTGWLALADCLEERGEADRAELIRVQLWLRRRLDDPRWPAWEGRLRQLWSAGIQGCQPARRLPGGMALILIPPGEFWMGAPEEEAWRNDDEGPRHRVRLTRGFWMAQTPITQQQWRAVMSSNRGSPQGDDLPVNNVDWYDAGLFCERLTELTKSPVRLPTEAEWEYACRAGSATAFCSGEDLEALRLVGLCSYDGTWDAAGAVQPVARYRPNSWGLYDMHGNLWEWCQDLYGGHSYKSGPTEDPAGAEAGEARVARGGSWRGGPWFCRSAERWSMPPGVGDINNGFRVVVEIS